MTLMERYIPTQEERLLSLVGFVPAEDILRAMGISTFRDETGAVLAQPIDSKLDPFDWSDCRPATKEEAALHVQAVNDYHAEEAACGLI